MILRFLRALRLGLALERLERAARARGANICIHDSWCGSSPGYWIVLTRPRGREAPMGKPATAWGLAKAMGRASDGLETSAE